MVEAAAGKPMLFFPARHDHWLVQTGDGWAAHVAGAIGVSTDANAAWWGGRGTGTIPHALIAVYGGDTVAAARDFAERFGEQINVVVPGRLPQRLGRGCGRRSPTRSASDLWGVRLDTSEKLVDVALAGPPGRRAGCRGHRRSSRPGGPRGLDAAGHERVRIVVSGGFDAEKIERFEAIGGPGRLLRRRLGSLLRGNFDFTADVVELDGRPAGKVGRELRPNPRLLEVD